MNTKSKLFTKIVLFTALFVFTASFTLAQGVKFEYKMDKGKTYIYTAATESKTTMTMMGQETAFTTKLFSLVNFECTDVLPNGNSALIMSYDSVKMEADNPQIPDMSAELSKLNGKKFKAIMTKSGKMQDVVSVDDFTVSEAMKGADLNPADRFKNLFQGFPEKELNVNDTWIENKIDTVVRQGSPMIIKNDIEYKYIGKENFEGKPAYKFSATTKGTLSGSGSQNGTEFTISGTIKSTSDVYYTDIKGTLLNSKSEAAMDMTIDISAMGMSMPMTVITSQIMKLVK
jgi:hypothetical protein